MTDLPEEVMSRVERIVSDQLARTEMVLTDPISLRNMMAKRVLREALSALTAEGYMVVPVNPSLDALKSGYEAAFDAPPWTGEQAAMVGAMWDAIVAAAPLPAPESD